MLAAVPMHGQRVQRDTWAQQSEGFDEVEGRLACQAYKQGFRIGV
ncbi:MAG: hypothetical protein V9G23_12675 [Giesbergeria sp.]